MLDRMVTAHWCTNARVLTHTGNGDRRCHLGERFLNLRQVATAVGLESPKVVFPAGLEVVGIC